MRNKKGFIESSFLVMQAIILAAIASTGTLFAGGAGGAASSGFLMVANGMVAYSQMPHVTKDFRQKKAVREFGVTMDEAKALSEDELLDLIRDDAPGYTSRANLMKANPNLYLGG